MRIVKRTELTEPPTNAKEEVVSRGSRLRWSTNGPGFARRENSIRRRESQCSLHIVTISRTIMIEWMIAQSVATRSEFAHLAELHKGVVNWTEPYNE